MIAFQFGTDDPQVVHVFTARGSESRDDRAWRAVNLGGSSSGTRPGHRLCQLDAGMIVFFKNFPNRDAFANGFVDGSAGSSAQSTQSAAIGAAGVMDWSSARTSGSLGHSSILSY
jgi:hypothetical protein